MTGVEYIHDFEVTDAQRRDLEALRALQIEKALLAAREHALLVRIAGAAVQVLEPEVVGARVSIPDPIRTEICLATGWSERFAAAQLADARLLATVLPGTREALADGRISEAHARVMCATVSRFDSSSTEVVARIESWVMPRLIDRPRPISLSRLRSMCNRAVRVVDPVGAHQRAIRARASFGVWVVDDVDGVSEVVARVPSLVARACVRRLDAMVAEAQAAQVKDGPGAGDAVATIGQLRANALETLIMGREPRQSTNGGVPATSAFTARIDVVVDLDVLLGLREGTALVDGVAEVDASSMRTLLVGPQADVTLRRLVTDPLTGELLDMGRSSYVPSERLREFIIARDGRCRFPGCGRRAANTDIDHAVAWNDLGETSRANLGSLCRRHHLLKTHAGFDIAESMPDGSCVWKVPSGAIIRHAPVPVRSRA